MQKAEKKMSPEDVTWTLAKLDVAADILSSLAFAYSRRLGFDCLAQESEGDSAGLDIERLSRAAWKLIKRLQREQDSESNNA